MVEQIFLLPQVKQSVIISKKLVYMSCLTSCRTTEDPGAEEIRKYQENLKTSQNFCLVPSPPPEMKMSVLAKNS